jgi:hypothetical protein
MNHFRPLRFNNKIQVFIVTAIQNERQVKTQIDFFVSKQINPEIFYDKQTE